LKAQLSQRKSSDAIRAFYDARHGRTAWIRHGKPTSSVDDLIELLAAAGEEGLHPEEYGADQIKKRVAALKGDAKAAMEVELAITASLMRYATHLVSGHPIAKQIDPSWTATPRKLDVAKVASAAVDHDDLDDLPEKLAPKHPEYTRLKELLKEARAAKPPDQARIRRLELNLERWRWLPDDLGSPHVLVDIPAFELQVRESADAIPVRMKVIVGKDTNRTPIFDDEMTEVVFSPYWNVPQSIEMKEMVPKLQEDSDFLEKNNMEVVRVRDGKAEVVPSSKVDWSDLQEKGDLQIRQKPGADNALGYIKFIFPNRYNVYLHDTPNDNLFAKLTRDLSHGCVRVEKPVDLAHYVLKDQSEWTPEKIDEAMHAGKEKHVALKHAIPVHLVYFTLWPGPDGKLQEFDDVYGYEAKQSELWGEGGRAVAGLR